MTAVDWPARQAFVSEQVLDKTAVTNAVALNNTLFNIARVIGPALGGILIAAVGIPWTFALNALSFIAVIASLVMMEAGRTPVRAERSDMKTEVVGGIKYIRDNPAIMSLLAIVGFLSLFVLNFNVTVPSFSKIALGMGSDAYGGLMAVMGAGALAAGLMVAFGGDKVEPKPAFVYAAGFILCIGTILVGVQRNLILSGLFLAVCGFGMSLLTTMCNTSVQMQSSDKMRGMVMSVYNLVFVGVTPFGSLYSGLIADWLDTGWAFTLSGILGVAFLLYMRIFVTPKSFKGIESFVRPRVPEPDNSNSCSSLTPKKSA